MTFVCSKIKIFAILLLTLIGSGCASPSGLGGTAGSAAGDFHQLVSDNVKDPARKKQATALTTKMGEHIVGLFEKIGKLQGELFDLNADYDTTRAQFNTKMTEASGLRTDTSEQLIRLVLDLRKHTTADEWNRIQKGMTAYRED